MKRYLGSVVVALILVGVLASCAPAAPATPAKPAPVAPSAPAPATPAKPAQPATPAAPAAKAKEIVRFLDSGVGTSAWIWANARAFLIEKHSTWLKMEVVPTKGHVDSMTLLVQGKGIANTSAGFLAPKVVKGTDEFKTLGPKPELRFVDPYSQLYWYAAVLDSSPIKGWTGADLKGRKIFTRELGSQSAIVMWGLLQAVGLDPAKDIKLIYGTAYDGIAAVSDGTADIYGAIGGMPYSALEEMFTSKAGRLVPVTKEVVQKAEQILGGGGALAPAIVPAKLFKGQNEPVPTGTNFGMVFSTTSVKDDIIYEMVKMWWDYMDERNELSAEIARQATVQNLQANIATMAASGIQLHNGAAKYYKEKGWVK